MEDSPREDTPGLLCLLAKDPRLGKTRLVASLLETKRVESNTAARKFATSFAHAALADLLTNLKHVATFRCVMYAPPTQNTRQELLELLTSLQLDKYWQLLPVVTGHDSQSADLSLILSNAIAYCREIMLCKVIVLIGMDSPDISEESIDKAYRVAQQGGAYICPALDGGYVALALPATQTVQESAFNEVLWSCSSTCRSQIAALSRIRLTCTVGEEYGDVDDLSDLEGLAWRICTQHDIRERCSHVYHFLTVESNSFPILYDVMTTTCPM